ncbi:hypothetical protein D3C83_18250 [compost metagenome]
MTVRLGHGDAVLGISLPDDAGLLEGGVHRRGSIDDVLPAEHLGERRRRIDAVLQGNDGGAFREQRPQRRRDPLDGPHLRGHDHDIAGADGSRIELGPDFNAESAARCDHGQAVLPDRRQVPLGDQQADVHPSAPQHCTDQSADSAGAYYAYFHCKPFLMRRPRWGVPDEASQMKRPR